MKCIYYRWRISLALDSDNPQANLPHAHLARCQACRAFHAQAVAAANALAGEARPQEALSASEGGRALIRRSHSEGVSEGPSADAPIVPAPAFTVSIARRWAVRGAGLAAAACLVAAIVMLGSQGGERPVQDQRIAPAPSPTPLIRPSAPLQDPPPDFAAAMPQVQMIADAATRPFIQEAQRTLADARAVGKALASYLPIQAVARQREQDTRE